MNQILLLIYNYKHKSLKYLMNKIYLPVLILKYSMKYFLVS